ncbi:MAG: CBS domain-containing protein [Gemmatimonadota bacterium]
MPEKKTPSTKAPTKKAEAKKPAKRKANAKKPASKAASKTGPKALVADVMSSPAHRVNASASLNDAAQLMWEHDIGVVPVVDSNDRVQGIVTDRDIAMAAYIQGRALQSIPVREVMSTRIQWTRTDEPIVQAGNRMAQHQMRRLPVLDDNETLVGMLSLNDLAGASANPRLGVTEGDVADTLRAVCAPRTPPEHVIAT